MAAERVADRRDPPPGGNFSRAQVLPSLSRDLVNSGTFLDNRIDFCRKSL
jgi:hypothetical protein